MRQKSEALKEIVSRIEVLGAKFKPEFMSKRDFDRAFFKSATDSPEETLYMAYTNRACQNMSDMVRSVQGVENLDLADVGEFIKVKNILTEKGRCLVPNGSVVQVTEVDSALGRIKINFEGSLFWFLVDTKGEVEKSYANALKEGKKEVWVAHKKLSSKYGSLVHPCVSTVHSSQGKTKQNVFLYWSDILRCTTDPSLPYVAASRASENLFFLR
jgi:hypothetical protein